MEKRTAAILHNIRSVYNVGAIFRTADAAGISKLYLTGYTPTPLDRFGKVRTDLVKASLGAEKTVAWEQVANPFRAIARLKEEKYKIIGIELADGAVDYKKIKIKGPTVFLLGNEVSGISKALLKKCDQIAEIPMRGKKESLNVSVAFGIALFRMLNI